jgi:hypothetical protein
MVAAPIADPATGSQEPFHMCRALCVATLAPASA